VLRKHGGDLAAVIAEPIMANMGCILPRDGYLQRLRELTRDYGVLLILDEVVTGFRYAPGGCQEYYGIQPDLSTFGKALGAGFPVGAVAGSRSILERLRWGDGMVLHYGTFNGHRLTMKVVATNLDLLSVDGGYRKLHATGEAAILGSCRDSVPCSRFISPNAKPFTTIAITAHTWILRATPASSTGYSKLASI
jgi:glutamate-1-semialdehyde 2,1-aminomutase